MGIQYGDIGSRIEKLFWDIVAIHTKRAQCYRISNAIMRAKDLLYQFAGRE